MKISTIPITILFVSDASLIIAMISTANKIAPMWAINRPNAIRMLEIPPNMLLSYFFFRSSGSLFNDYNKSKLRLAQNTLKVLNNRDRRLNLKVHESIRNTSGYFTNIKLYIIFKEGFKRSIMQWIEYQIFVNHPDNRERLILSLMKELKEQFLKEGLIDTYHFLRYGGGTEQGRIRFRLGKEVGIDKITIDRIRSAFFCSRFRF